MAQAGVRVTGWMRLKGPRKGWSRATANNTRGPTSTFELSAPNTETMIMARISFAPKLGSSRSATGIAGQTLSGAAMTLEGSVR